MKLLSDSFRIGVYLIQIKTRKMLFKKVVTYLKQCTLCICNSWSLQGLVCFDKLEIPVFISNKTEKAFRSTGSIILTTANTNMTATYQETARTPLEYCIATD